MRVRELVNSDYDRVDEFVRSCENATPQHLSAWKDVMEEVFNSDVQYFLAEENNNIVGVLPLITIKSLVAGNYLTSFPGGLCAINQEAAEMLLNRAKEIISTSKAKYLILRDGRRKWDFPDLVTDEDHVTFQIKIPPNLDQIKREMERRTRQLINQASKNNLEAIFGFENLEDYYPIFSKTMQELGTPTLGFPFFKSMAAHFPNETNLLTIKHQDKIVGGGFIAQFKRTIFCTWSGLPREYYNLRTSHLLTWETIEHAHQNGYQYVDLGRCRKNSGGFTFKKVFGGKPIQLYQQIYTNGTDQLPKVGSAMKEDQSYRYFVNIWRRLPRQITEVLGPELRKRIPFG